MNNRVKNEIYNLFRKAAVKAITGNMGRVVEYDDKIICYVKKAKIEKNKYEYSIWCYGYEGSNMKLANIYHINKPIYYVIDGLDFSDRLDVRILGYKDANICIKNCNFGYQTHIHSEAECLIENSKFCSLSLSSSDTLIFDGIEAMSFEYFHLSAKKIKMNNSNIKCQNTAGLYVYGDLFLNNVNISSERNVFIRASNNIISNDSLIKANESIDIQYNSINGLDVVSPSIICNENKVGSGKMHLTKEAIDLIDKRTQLVNVLNKIRLNCESVCEEEIKKFYNRPLSKVLKIK